MKKLTIINLLVALLLLSGCAAHTPTEDTKSTLNDLSADCQSSVFNIKTDEMEMYSTSGACTGYTDQDNLASNVIKSEINTTMCDINDYSVDVEGEVKNDSKQIVQIRMSGSSSLSAIAQASQKGEVEQCITVPYGKTSIDLYFKIKNCDNLFIAPDFAAIPVSVDCSLTIKNHTVANHKRELTIGPFKNDYEMLQRTNNKGVRVNQSNMQGITVVTPEEFYKTKMEEKYYLKLEW